MPKGRRNNSDPATGSRLVLELSSRVGRTEICGELDTFSALILVESSGREVGLLILTYLTVTKVTFGVPIHTRRGM